jgi:hypothetical protein
VAGVYYSTQICDQDLEYEEKCPFQDVAMTREIKTVVFDHSIMGYNDASCMSYANASRACEFVNFRPSLNAERGAISQNESMIYTFRILGATRQHPLVVAMTYTDPVGVLGASTVLVNDLDLNVRFTPLFVDKLNTVTQKTPIKAGANGTAYVTAALKKNLNSSTLYYGNAIGGGDSNNNAEIVRIEEAGPAEVEAIVYGRRLRDSLEGSTGLCQPFALVITGQIDLDIKSEPIPIRTSPEQLEAGICGREPAIPPPPPEGLTDWQIALIVVGSVIVGLLIIFACYKFIYARTVRKFDSQVNKSKPGLVGYLSKLEKPAEEEGVARGGAHDHIILSEQASGEDNFYQVRTEESIASSLSLFLSCDLDLICRHVCAK